MEVGPHVGAADVIEDDGAAADRDDGAALAVVQADGLAQLTQVSGWGRRNRDAARGKLARDAFETCLRFRAGALG